MTTSPYVHSKVFHLPTHYECGYITHAHKGNRAKLPDNIRLVETHY